MKVIIDRFEGTYAIVEITKGVFEQIPNSLLPDAQEGDIINISIEKTETKKRKEEIKKLMNQVFED